MWDYKISKYRSKINSTTNKNKINLYNLKISYYKQLALNNRQMATSNNGISSMYGGNLDVLNTELNTNLGKHINFGPIDDILNDQLKITKASANTIKAFVTKGVTSQLTDELNKIKDAAIQKEQEASTQQELTQQGGAREDEIIATLTSLERELNDAFAKASATSSAATLLTQEIIKIINELKLCRGDLVKANDEIAKLTTELAQCKKDVQKPPNCIDIQKQLDAVTTERDALLKKLADLEKKQAECQANLLQKNKELTDALENIANKLKEIMVLAKKTNTTTSAVKNLHDSIFRTLDVFTKAENKDDPNRFSTAIGELKALTPPKAE